MMSEAEKSRAESCRRWALRHPLFAASLWVVLAYVAWQWMPVLLPLVVLLLIASACLMRHWIGVGWMVAVFVAIGREAPLDFFRKSGVRLRGELRPMAVALLLAQGQG